MRSMTSRKPQNIPQDPEIFMIYKEITSDFNNRSNKTGRNRNMHGSMVHTGRRGLWERVIKWWWVNTLLKKKERKRTFKGVVYALQITLH